MIVKKLARFQSGFTIVELLIVIVVIAVLAAITVVAYNGIQSRTKASAVMIEIRSIDKAFKMYAEEDGLATWPIYPGNPSIAALLRTTNLKNYLSGTPQVDGMVDADWYYDNDGDAYGGCTVNGNAANLYVKVTDAEASRLIDQQMDDGLPTCGRIRYDAATGGSFHYVIGLTQQVGS